MGRLHGPMNADFPAGTRVRIASQATLKGFQRPQWQYHHPLGEPQLAHADQIATVAKVFYYHGGDELYELEEVPGIWHEQCLEQAP